MDLFEWALKITGKRLQPSSLATYKSWFGTYQTRLAEPGEDVLPSQPGRESTEQMLRALEGQGDYLTQKRTLALLAWVYRTLQRHGHDLQDQTEAIEGLYRAGHRTTHDAMPPSLQQRLIEAAHAQAKGWKGTRLVAMVRLLTDAALKTSELIRLETGDIQGDDPYTLQIRRAAETRLLPLSADTSSALRDWLAVHPAALSSHVFVRDAGGLPMDASTVWRQLVRVATAAGIDSEAQLIGTGAIRASKAKELIAQGLSTQEISRFLGHRQADSTGELLSRIR